MVPAMRRLLAVCLIVALAGGCAAPTPTALPPTPVPAKPTAAPTNTPGADYVALRTALLTPLGGLIVATRDQSATRAAQLAAFNSAAETVDRAIAGDMSVNANRLHSAIVNTRDAAARGDVASLETQRVELMAVR